MTLPTPDECRRLLKAVGCSDEVIAHCEAVRTLAVLIASKAEADVALVEVGALLHDIGRSKTQGMMHAVEGARIAIDRGLPSEVVNIIERHMGAGIPRAEAAQLGLPEKDYVPQTIEEKIVAHADNLINNDHRQPIENEIEKALRKGRPLLAARLRALHEELSARCGQDLNTL
jgi:tRNA (cytidine56-2'-O)-methyltransferase